MTRLKPLRKLMEEVGVVPTRGQIIYLARRLHQMGAVSVRIKDEHGNVCSHVDSAVVTPEMVKGVVSEMRHVQVKPKESVPLEYHEPPSPPSAPAATPKPEERPAPADWAEAIVQLWNEHFTQPLKRLEEAVKASREPVFDAATAEELSLAQQRIQELENEVAERARQQLEAAKQVTFLEDKLSKAGSPKVQFELPSDVVWKSREWRQLRYTAEFWKDWSQLNDEQRAAVRRMLLHLTQNPSHPGLHTRRPIGGKKATNFPAGVADDAYYSRASDTIRVWWQERLDGVTFYRIIVKVG